MNVKTYCAVLGWLVVLGACSGAPVVMPTWNTVGGSRANGTVRLAYEKTGHLDASNEEGLALAKKRCAAWGYEYAESFDYNQTTCLAYGKKRCRQWRVEREYQCTRANDKEPSTPNNININIHNNGSGQPNSNSGERSLKPL